MTIVDMTKPAAAGDDDHPERPAASGTQPTRATPPADAGEDRRPVADKLAPQLPGWLTDRHQLADTTRKTVMRGGHWSLWHGIRLPLYTARLIGYSPRGCWRVLRQLWAFLWDEELRPLRIEAVTSSDPKTAMVLRRERNDRIHRRVIVAGVLAAFGAVALVVASLLAPGWAMWAAAAGTVLIAGWVGRPVDKRITRPAGELVGNPGPVRAPLVMQALCDIGIGRMRDPASIRLVFDVARQGPGYHVGFELPPGVTAVQVMEKREELAAALRREIGTVWPSKGVRHPGHLALYVSDQPMNSAKQTPWPLLKTGGVDVFRPCPLFTDQQGGWVPLTLAYTHGVVGGVPGSGKTFGLRQIGVAAALDPRVKLFLLDGKGNGDLAPLALVADVYKVGDEDEEIADQLNELRRLREEMRRRARVIREQLTREECPESKVTSTLADRRDLGLEPILVLVDEVQVYAEHEDKKVREEFVRLFTDLVKRGRSAGIMCYFATQKPDASALPSAIASNSTIRLAFKVNDWQSNDQILGTSAHQNGLRATLFGWNDRGLAYLKGDGADAQIVRTIHGMDAVAAEKVVLRAHAARQAQHRLTGYALGEEARHEADQATLLDDVRHVIGTSSTMHLEQIREGLELLRPGIYGHADNNGLGRLLRTAGVRVASVHVTDRGSHKGVRREWLDVAVTDVIGDAQDGENGTGDLTGPGET